MSSGVDGHDLVVGDEAFLAGEPHFLGRCQEREPSHVGVVASGEGHRRFPCRPRLDLDRSAGIAACEDLHSSAEGKDGEYLRLAQISVLRFDTLFRVAKFSYL